MTKKNTIISFLLLIILGSAIVWWVVKSTEMRLRSELIQEARIAAQSIPLDYLTLLTASEKDLNTPAYQRIKSQLSAMRKAKYQCRFLYLMGRHSNGKVFFFVDSLSPDSEDYAPPGLIYDEVPKSYLTSFDAKKEAVVGPVTDRWGTLITALIPIVYPPSNTLLAVLGMDVNAQDWNRLIFNRCIGPFLVILLLAFLIILLAARERTLQNLRQALAEIRTLSGLLPICSHCKKIRDDKGYWNQLESFIKKNSDAEFTHGICPECVKVLYPDLDIYDE